MESAMKIIKRIKKIDRNILILCAIFVIITPLFLTPWIHGNDGAGYYSYLHSVLIDNDIDFKNEREHFNQTQFIRSIDIDPNTERHFIQYPIGTALLWSPYFVFGHTIAFITGMPMDGYSMPYVYMVCLGSAINAFIGIILIYLMLKKYFDKKIAMLSLLTIWLASPLFYYMYLEGSLSHANSFFIFTLFVYFWHETINKRTTKQWAILGFLAGLAFLVRYQNAIILVLPLLEVVKRYNKSLKIKDVKSIINELKNNLISALSFFIIILPQLILLKIKHGSFIVNYSGEFHLNLISQQVIDVIFSSQHGLFNWTPVLFLGLIGLFIMYRKNKIMISSFVIIFLLNLFIVSGWSIWYAGQSFGHRMFVDMTIIFVFGFAALIDKLSKKIKLVYISIFCLALVLWNFGLMIQYGSGMVDPAGAVSFKERLSNNFIEVPKKFLSILQKFIFNRGSFLG